MDHGILNLPLAKRGDIDAQIDRWKARKTKEEREAYKALQAQHAFDQAKAKEMVLNLSEERAAEMCKQFNLTGKRLKAKLYRIAHWTPEVILRGI